jgi:hypothetical protein
MELPCLSNKKIKHISELTDEELFKQLEGSENLDIDELQSVQIIQTPLLDFIHKFDIKQGKFPVPAKALAMLYRKTTGDTRIKETSFINKMRQYFRVIDNMVYINKSVFHFHAELETLLNKKRRVRITSEAFTKHVLKFLDDTGIKKGPVPVPCIILYHIYREYCYKIKRTPIAKMNFYLFADKLWEKITTQHGESYLVNNKGDLYNAKDYKKIQKIYEKKHKGKAKIKRSLKKTTN